MAMKVCDDTELLELYKDLRKYNDNKPLNSFLELEFKNRLGNLEGKPKNETKRDISKTKQS
jgi:hypothetical protein